MRRRLSMALFCGLAWVALPAAGGGIELVKGGKALARIIIAEDAAPPERFAAAELASAIEAMSGVRLPVLNQIQAGAEALLLVGPGAVRLAGADVLAASQLDDVKGDGYAITTMADRNPPVLTLVGKQPRGTLYAVYSLLEDTLHCGFFTDGGRIPNRPEVIVPRLPLLPTPAFGVRAVYVPTFFYGPRRFQATLWNAEEWRVFLRWMARKRQNALVVEFSGATRAWGAAFDQAFPEAKALRRQAPPAESLPPTASESAKMGWGLSPEYTTSVLKEAFDYARKTLGIEIVYLFRVGEFEPALQLALPKLSWQQPANPGVAGPSPSMAITDPACRELQERLWKAVLQTYGTDHRYILSFESQPPVPKADRPHETIGLALDLLCKIDPDAKPMLDSTENSRWGVNNEAKTAFLAKLPKSTGILYLQGAVPTEWKSRTTQTPNLEFETPGSPADTLYVATRYFSRLPYWYGATWGEAHSDLFEQRFFLLYYMFRHHRQYRMPEHPLAVGLCNWNEVRGSNPLMDNLLADFAWTGLDIWRSEGASDNRFVRGFLGRRYTPGLARPVAEVLKLRLQGAPSGETRVNPRFYLRRSETPSPGLPSDRAAIVLALNLKAQAQASPYYEMDVAEMGRNYLHRLIENRYRGIIALVGEAKKAAQANAYTAQAKTERLAEFTRLEGQVVKAHQALQRVVATRKDMCLDDVILDALKTPGANPRIERAIREQQCGVYNDGYCLVDSIEYHQEVASRQIRFFLDAARKEVEAPSANGLPSWREVSLVGTREFINRTGATPYATKAERTPASQILAEFLKAVE